VADDQNNKHTAVSLPQLKCIYYHLIIHVLC